MMDRPSGALAGLLGLMLVVCGSSGAAHFERWDVRDSSGAAPFERWDVRGRL